jgi:class 3 adenylate cyclase
MVSERPVRVERRLAAILVADVAGYSRLMHSDEETTHAKLTALLSETVGPAIAKHGGRIVKNTGDGFLAEFPSAVEAVRAAIQFQTRVYELTASEAEDRRIAFRVGVNIGDVIVEPHDIFGDGVNIASRLESIAEPGGICISSSAYDQVLGKVAVEFVDLGEQRLKNIARPVRAYAAVWGELGQAIQSRGVTFNPSSAPRLSIVVLPFVNLSGDPEQDYFVRWCNRELDHGLVAHQRLVRDRAQHRVLVQGQVNRHTASRARVERPLCAGRLGAARLSPRDNGVYRWLYIVGAAKLQLCADAEAVAWIRRGLEVNRNYPVAHFHLAAALALLGKLDEARAAVKDGLALDPYFTRRRFLANPMSDNPTFLAAEKRVSEGMRMAGVPNG